MRTIILLGLASTLFACSATSSYEKQIDSIYSNKLPEPSKSISIANLGPCTDSVDQTLKINPNHPITILVHGCNGSAGRFRSLAQLYAFHGQQTACYSYDDRDSLRDSADKLVIALQKLSAVTNNKNISVVGHSMGGLVARKAMEQNKLNHWENTDVNIKLITVSAPLSGIKAANSCSYASLNWLSFGVVPGICWGITGNNWYEITSRSSFINDLKPLLPFVERYLKVVTNEEGTCRKTTSNGECIESDYVFELSEQYQPIIDGYSQVTNVQVNAGHVEIVGYKDVAPRKLLAILQQQKMLSPTTAKRQSALELLFAKLY